MKDRCADGQRFKAYHNNKRGCVTYGAHWALGGPGLIFKCLSGPLRSEEGALDHTEQRDTLAMAIAMLQKFAYIWRHNGNMWSVSNRIL